LSCECFFLGGAVDALFHELSIEIYRLEQWRENAVARIDGSLKKCQNDPVQAESTWSVI